MKNGYYLFCYLVVDELASDYKVYLRHDQNFSLWKKTNNQINLIHYWELERITRNKQHYLPLRTKQQAVDLINYCLKEYEITLDDMVEILGTPNISNENQYAKLCIYKDYAIHTISHLYSTIMTNTELFYHDNIVGFAVDAAPDYILEWNHVKRNVLIEYVGCIIRKGKMEIFPTVTPGLLWFVAVMKYGYREGTLMALASASESRFVDDESILPKLVNPNNLDEVFDYVERLDILVSSLIKQGNNKMINHYDARFSQNDNIISIVMKIIQKKSIEIMEKNVIDIINKYHIDTSKFNLAIGGGYALNCPTNSYLVNKFRFKSFIAPPCVNDAGQSMGMALCYFKNHMNKFNFKLSTAYYGDAIKGDCFNQEKYKEFISGIHKFDCKQAVKDIIANPIVWCMGASEIGPRALGHRSIIADPRSIDSKNRINEIKKRQWWRPVAPIIKEEELKNWFHGNQASPYMLCTYKVKESKEDLIPAVLHLDKTARVQTVNERNDKKLYQLIDEFHKATGVPIVCNTSLNDAGEPIINSMDEAINFALRKRISIVYFDNYRVELKNFSKYKEELPLEANEDVKNFFKNGTEEEKLDINPYQLEYGYIKYYFNRLNLSFLDIRKKKDIDFIKKVFLYEANQSVKLYKLFDLEDEI